MNKLISLILVLMLVLSVCAFGEAPVKLDVGVLASYYSAAIYYADKMGYDTEEGIDFVIQEFASGAPMNESFAVGELELADMGPAAVHAVGKFGAFVIAQNAKQVAVNLMVRPDSPLLAVQDENGVYGSAELVKGMTVMGPSGTYAHYLIIGYLNYLGLSIDDVKYVAIQYPQASAAFELGDGDICAMQNPNVYDAKQNGYVSLGDPAIVAPMYENLVCAASACDNKTEAVVKALKVIYRAQEDFINDEELAAKWLKEYYAHMGYSASDEAIMDEIQNQKPLLTLAEAVQVPVGESLIDTALFMQDLDMIEQWQTDAVKQNIRSDLLYEAAGISAE